MISIIPGRAKQDPATDRRCSADEASFNPAPVPGFELHGDDMGFRRASMVSSA